jgi:hypothetical protein
MVALLMAASDGGGTNANQDEPGLPRVLDPSDRSSGRPAPLTPSSEADRNDDHGAHVRVAPWIGIGLSAALGVAGAIFVSRTADALSQNPMTAGLGLTTTAATTTIPAAIRQQEHDVFLNGLLASVFISAAIAGLVTSTLMFID